MEPIKITLCAACDHCPSVEIDDSGVRIGENHNTVSLTHAEWNDLVARVQRGELTPAAWSYRFGFKRTSPSGAPAGPEPQVCRFRSRLPR